MQDHNEWLKFAYDDLKSAKRFAEGDDPIISTGMFHTQQCAEKFLKAFLVYKNEPIRRIHDLVALLNLCKNFDTEFETIRQEVMALNPYLCQTRYPDDCFLMPDVTALKVSILQAQSIYDFVLNKITD